MSLYNTLFGQNPMSGFLLAMLSLDTEKWPVGRFRDIYVRKDEESGEVLIVLFTRNGGGNRGHWHDNYDEGEDCDCPGCVIAYRLPKHPLYVRDYDDDFDCTYASIEFKVPEDYREAVEGLVAGQAPMERFKELIDKMQAGDTNDPAVKEAMEKTAPIFEKIKKALDGDGPNIVEV